MTSLPTQQKVWILAHKVTMDVPPDTFDLETRPLPELHEGQVLVRIDYISNDPSQRTRIQEGARARGALPMVNVGEPMMTYASIMTVLDSRSSKWKTGDRAVGTTPWVDYAVLSDTDLRERPTDLPGLQAASLSILGAPTQTAYHGIMDVLNVQPEHTVTITNAAGSVGSLSIQLAKKVCHAKRVVGIAGGADKCQWVVDVLGADACVDYKSSEFASKLVEAVQGGSDRHLESVGGSVMDTCLSVIKDQGVIAFCGAISTYHGTPTTLHNLVDLASNRITLHGFNLSTTFPQWKKREQQVAQWVEDGTVVADQTEVIACATIEQVPAMWNRIFTGQVRGRLVTKLVN